MHEEIPGAILMHLHRILNELDFSLGQLDMQLLNVFHFQTNMMQLRAGMMDLASDRTFLVDRLYELKPSIAHRQKGNLHPFPMDHLPLFFWQSQDVSPKGNGSL